MSDSVKYKYPSTPHLNFSPGLQNDDRRIQDMSVLEACSDIVITEKMDGEAFTGYSNGDTHARSLDSRHHVSRSAVKNIHSSIAHELPEGWRICGENLYAVHSIEYTDLKGYLYVFSIWDENNIRLSWDDIVKWCNLLGLQHVPVLYRGPWNSQIIEELPSKMDLTKQEGFVVADGGRFHYDDFDKHMAKYVRKNHVQTDEFWMNKPVVSNKLKE